MTKNKRSKKKYKVIFLDWNGTISGSKFWGHLEDETHPNNHLFQKTESALFGELRHLLKPWMRGEATSEDVIAQISERASLEYDTVLNEFIESCKSMKLATDKLYDLTKKLQQAGTKVVIATDNMDSFPRWTVPTMKLNEIFDDVLDSHTLKAMKGDFDDNGNNLFFHDYLTRHAIKPGESTLIDDSEDKEGRIGNMGIEYRRIEPVVGLETELLKIIDLLS
ncbi:hypothetical protein KJ953_00230 [Patescibacteria group bacterium]|nr:hypothetical protein [Patescibacteria group bacterium]MBU1256166.1 hypothetical protein [Patescibacteria group bacterium]MBU1457345.1 hypothetical protein [Patescibacteria group bacterium]